MGQPFEEKFTPSPDSCFKYKIGKEENREMVEVSCFFSFHLKFFVWFDNSLFWNKNIVLIPTATENEEPTVEGHYWSDENHYLGNQHNDCDEKNLILVIFVT